MENQITINVKAALEAILPVAIFASNERSVSDVYKHVLIKHDGTKCFAIGSNGSQSLIRAVTLPMLAMEPFCVCLDGVKLRAILSGLKDASEQDMTMSWNDASATIKVGRSKLTLSVINPDGYPSPERLGAECATVVLPIPVMIDALRSAIHAVAVNDVRFFLNGCFVKFDENTLTVAGSDGFRVCRIVKNVGSNNAGQGILPTKFIDLLSQNAGKIAGDVRIRLTANMVEATWDGGQLRSNLIDGKYPDISAFFNAEHTPLFQCSKESILNSIARLRATVYDKLPSLSIEACNSELRLVTLDEHKAESGIDFLVATVQSDMKPLSININYLSDCINNIDDDNLDFMLAKTGGVVIKPSQHGAYQEIIQPLRR